MKYQNSIVLSLLLLGNGHLHSQWTNLAQFSQVMSDLEVFDNKLFIGGGFTSTDGNTCYWSAYYNGSTIVAHSSPIAGGGINDLKLFNGNLYATGSMNISSSMGISVWNDVSWNSAGSFTESHSGIFADGNDLYIGSDFGKISVKSGTGSFTPMPSMDDLTDNIYDINKYGGNIIIAGNLDTYNSVALNNIAYWDGTDWQPLGTGLSGEVRCMAVYNGELYVGGNFNTAGGVSAKDIAKWDGASWSDVSGSLTGGGFNGVRDMLVYNGRLYVVGDFDEIGGVVTDYVAYLEGNTWYSLSLTTTSSFANCIEVYDNNLYVGTFDFGDAYLYGMAVPLAIENNNSHAEVMIYPNPSVDEFTLLIESNEQNTSWVIFGLDGKNYLSGSCHYGENLIDIRELNKGLYLLKIEINNNEYSVKKIVKQ